jgi:hypothetical protein
VKIKIQKSKILLLSEDEIKKAVESSQRIEGYEPVFIDVTRRVKALMKKYTIKVSV